MNRRRDFDPGALVFGAVLLFVGGYYLLRNTFGFAMEELDGEKIWPLVVIAIGIAIVYRSWARSRNAGGGDRPG
jgi:hypothetical protein